MFEAFLTALQFLTRISLKRDMKVTDELLKRSMIFFPIVGALIGGVQVVALFLTYELIPNSVTALLLLFLPLILTGALHIEGFLDMVDGFLSGKEKNEILHIMRDSHVGTMGVVAGTFLILTKFVLLKEIIGELTLLSLVGTLLLVPSLSRFSMVVAAASSRYARGEEGLGRPFTGISKGILFLSGFLPLGATIFFFRIYGLIGIGITLIIVGMISKFSTKKIGGITGDVLGATNEIVEAGLLLYAIVIGKILR